MYEVGRPRRLTVEQAQEKERQWQDFGERLWLLCIEMGSKAFRTGLRRQAQGKERQWQDFGGAPVLMF